MPKPFKIPEQKRPVAPAKELADGPPPVSPPRPLPDNQSITDARLHGHSPVIPLEQPALGVDKLPYKFTTTK